MNLQLLTNNKKVEQVVYGREYTLRADITHADGKILISSKAKKKGIIDRVAAVCKKKQRSLILTHRLFYQFLNLISSSIVASA